MKGKVAINGFGRIGRMVFRRAMELGDVEIVAINASYPAEALAHLVKYDTTHGRFSKDITYGEDFLRVESKHIQLVSERNPEVLPWEELGVDVVIEATGKFNSKEKAMAHIRAGAKKVILTAPGKEEDITIVVGVNDQELLSDHTIISNASCTTNCLAPVTKVLQDTFGIENGLMTTVHAYTNDQRNIDNPHNDLRRARACGQSIIPTSTGAAKAMAKVLPDLEGKLHGMALRVPTTNVSLVDLVVDVERAVTAEKVNEAFRQAANGPLKGIMAVSDEPLVSVDYNTNPHSCIVDALSTMVMGDHKVKVLAWYDNEWGYSCRVVDLTQKVLQLLFKKQMSEVGK